MTTVTGKPDALEAYAERSSTTIDTWPLDWSDYGQQMTDYNAAPSDLPHTALNLHGRMIGMRGKVRATSRMASAFAKALRACDQIIGPVPAGVSATSDRELFEALMAAWTADPDATSDEAMAAALDALTGTPDQLADEFADIIADLDVGEDEVAELQLELELAMADVEALGADADGTFPTDEEVAERAWERIRARQAWEELDPSIGARLAEATAKLERRANDPDYTEAFFEELGPEDTLALAETASIVAWNDEYAGSGRAPSTGHTVEVVSEALATASPGLGQDFAQDLVDFGLTEEHEDTNGIWFGGGRDYLKLDDALPLLFSEGEFSTGFSQVIGQLGIDVLAGENADGTEIDVEKGLGSPFMDGFAELQTAWEGRGAVLVDAAARNAGAANLLLRNDRNAELLTDDELSWRDTDRVLFDDNVGNWDVIGGSVRNLLVAGTVTFEAEDPIAAREAAANVIHFATEQGPGAASDALAPAYGDIVVEYLPDFGHAREFASGDGLLRPVEQNGHLELDVLTGAQFVSLAMADDDATARILAQRDRVVSATALLGLDQGLTDPDWEQRIAATDAMITGGLNGQELLSAAQAAAAAGEFNKNVDLGRDMFLSILPLDKLPGPVGPLQDRAVDELSEAFLHRPTDQVDGAEHQVNLNTAYVMGSQRLLVADAYLTLAIQDEVSGRGTDETQAAFIDTARVDLGDDYVDSLFAVARGEDVELPARDAYELGRWSRDADLDLVAPLNNQTDIYLPEEAQALFP